MSRHYDAIIIGSGQAGPAPAGRLNSKELAALVRGTCVDTGNTPTSMPVEKPGTVIYGGTH